VDCSAGASHSRGVREGEAPAEPLRVYRDGPRVRQHSESSKQKQNQIGIRNANLPIGHPNRNANLPIGPADATLRAVSQNANGGGTGHFWQCPLCQVVLYYPLVKLQSRPFGSLGFSEEMVRFCLRSPKGEEKRP
jgi:hypothetical protein